MGTPDEAMRDHWWWRPGWNVGRRFYTWHLTFEGQEDIHRLAGEYRDRLADVPRLTLIPDRWLHLTMQGVGFVGEVSEQTVRDIGATAAARLAKIRAFDIEVGPAVIDPEAVLLPVSPAEPVRAVRDAIRAAIHDVMQSIPEQAEGFRPHVSVAYSAGTGPSELIKQSLAALTVRSATARITSAELIVLHRDNHMYEWTPYAQVELGE
ncbi:2'-5' RNA ligase family protein [Streptomyces sp. NPDC058653]|uniref:2'-5' RNA ligase family protein n=1 Tax=Streptomyces sp. NPDC058653 TaxID=3346576 RepID=UPI0036460517